MWWVMSPRVSTEVEGWIEALTDRVTLLTLLWRIVLATLCAVVGVVGPDHAPIPLVLLGVPSVVLVGSLVLLRARGRV